MIPRTEKLITVKEAAYELALSAIRVRQLCQQGRVKGARKIGRDWVIPTPIEVAPVTRPRGFHYP